MEEKLTYTRVLKILEECEDLNEAKMRIVRLRIESNENFIKNATSL